jgi:hypothetical protein
MTGIIIENSLQDNTVLHRLTILKTWQDGNWRIHEVQVSKAEAEELGKHLSSGPWYMHFWEKGKDDILVVYKDKVFHIEYSDKRTWQAAVAYGQSLGIPSEQLDFAVE